MAPDGNVVFLLILYFSLTFQSFSNKCAISWIRTPLRGSRGGGDPLKIITERAVLEAISSFFFQGFGGDPPVILQGDPPPLKGW